MIADALPPSQMEMSDQGVVYLMKREGNALVAYPDVGGVWTICTGAILDINDQPVVKGLRYNTQQCLSILSRDISNHSKAVQRCVFVPLYQYQFDALTSFAFNIGNYAFCGSTLVKDLNNGDFSAASNQFLKWTKITVKGRKVTSPGLESRRTYDKALFDEGKY